MKSDERMDRVVAALARPASRFRSTLATTVEQVRGSLPARVGDNGKPAEDDSGTELGLFSVGRIDGLRFAQLVSNHQPVDTAHSAALEQAHDTLAGLLARGEAISRLNVPSGGNLRDAVAAALTEVGRAFGAARVVDLSRAGCYESAQHDSWLTGFPFALWNRSERRLAPPLLVEVDGAGLLVDGLAEFLDGNVRIVLLVRGQVPPAALVRLISPGTFVLQTSDASEMDRLAAWDGPGVAALVPDGAAQFIHDPAGGPNPWDRLTILRLPDEVPRRSIGGISAAQQADQLSQLAVLAAAPAGPSATAMPASSPDDPIDKLAAWLLANANLADLP